MVLYTCKEVADMAITSRKATLKGMLADYIVGELIINRVKSNPENAFYKRVLCYYEKVYAQMMSTEKSP